jgi:LysR family transcriptional regulator, transcriptional activator of the cysJI operon
MEIRHLRTFALLAEYGSFTRVAAELGLSQPAVSGQLQALERELGTRLADRLPRRVRLTAAGVELHTYARRLLGLEAEAVAAMARLGGIESNRLRLGASPTVGAYVLPRLLATFSRRCPEARVVAEVGVTARVADLLRLYGIDCALVEAPVVDPDLVAFPFFNDELVLVVTAEHRWAARTSIGALELIGQRLVTREPESATRALVDRALQALGATVEPAFELGSVEAMKNAVIAGLGIAFLSREAIREEVHAGSLVTVPVDGLALVRPFFCLRRRYGSLPALVASFIEVAAAAAGGAA